MQPVIIRVVSILSTVTSGVISLTKCDENGRASRGSKPMAASPRSAQASSAYGCLFSEVASVIDATKRLTVRSLDSQSSMPPPRVFAIHTALAQVALLSTSRIPPPTVASYLRWHSLSALLKLLSLATASRPAASFPPFLLSCFPSFLLAYLAPDHTRSFPSPSLLAPVVCLLNCLSLPCQPHQSKGLVTFLSSMPRLGSPCENSRNSADTLYNAGQYSGLYRLYRSKHNQNHALPLGSKAKADVMSITQGRHITSYIEPNPRTLCCRLLLCFDGAYMHIHAANWPGWAAGRAVHLRVSFFSVFFLILSYSLFIHSSFFILHSFLFVEPYLQHICSNLRSATSGLHLRSPTLSYY